MLCGKCKMCEYYCDDCRKIQNDKERKGLEYKKPEGDSLCWCCANATPSETAGCNWSRDLEPVPGWEAKKHRVNNGSKGVTSYRVIRCPEFRRG